MNRVLQMYAAQFRGHVWEGVAPLPRSGISASLHYAFNNLIKNVGWWIGQVFGNQIFENRVQRLKCLMLSLIQPLIALKLSKFKL